MQPNRNIFLTALILDLFAACFQCYKLACDPPLHGHSQARLFLPLHYVQKKTPTHIFFHISMCDE